MNRSIEDRVTRDELSEAEAAAAKERRIQGYFALSDFDKAIYHAVTAHEAGHVAVLLALGVEVYGVLLNESANDDGSELQAFGQIISAHMGGPEKMSDLGPFVAAGFGGYFAERHYLRERRPQFQTRAESVGGACGDFAAITHAHPLSNSPEDLAAWSSFVMHWARISHAIIRDGWEWIEEFIDALEDCPHMSREEIELNDIKYVERLGRSIVRKHNKGWKPPIEIVRAMRVKSRAKSLNARKAQAVASQIST